MAERMSRMFHPLAAGKGLAFQVSVDDGVPRAIEADVYRLEQVLANLVSNAIKFTEAGTVKLRVFEEGADDSAGHRIGFSVSDTGIGISPEELEKLFQPFSQVDAFVARKVPGTGLGLVIARRICSLMGGEISVASEPGAGSEFVARIVCRSIAPEKAGLVRAAPTGPGEADFSGLRVLVAEDNTVNQKLISAILSRWNISPVLVDSGEAVVARAQAEVYDLILMDIQMGGMDGFEAARLIRRDGGVSRPMIIALTAFALADDEERFGAEMDGYLPKPLNFRVLRDVLGRAAAAKGNPLLSSSATGV
jgi:CheY-like chemotaxis protein